MDLSSFMNIKKSLFYLIFLRMSKSFLLSNLSNGNVAYQEDLMVDHLF